jgi:hypothetical protein
MNSPDEIFLGARATPEPNTGCWLWTAAIGGDGYGRVSRGGIHWRAHRLAWDMEHGPVPDGLDVCHRCDNRACVNPDHLFLGTRAENLSDMTSKGRRAALIGDRAPGRKLCEAQVAAILSRLRSGERRSDVARAYGVSWDAVGDIAKGRSWSHLPR